VSFASLDRAFDVVGAVLFGGNEVVDDVLGGEEIQKGRRHFVVEDLNFEFVTEITEDLVGG
jgi:hypothetical protein